MLFDYFSKHRNYTTSSFISFEFFCSSSVVFYLFVYIVAFAFINLCFFPVSLVFYCLFCAGKVEDCKNFFRTLYKFIYILGTYMKPHVSIVLS